MQYHTVEQIGPKRSKTAHGAMLCHDVPIGRTGLQLYGPGETPIANGTSDVVRIERDADEVFHPLCIASLHGVPVVNEHPSDEYGGRADVTLQNWRDLAIGHCLNPHRGEGVDDDVLMADLLIWDQNAIDLINNGKRELSIGYDADYEVIGPGHGRQRNIRANHIALVDQGRCGPRCAIGDNQYHGLTRFQTADHFTMEDDDMARTQTWRDRVRAAFRARDADDLEEAMSAAPDKGDGDDGDKPSPPPKVSSGGGEQHVHVHLPGSSGSENSGDPPPDDGGGDDPLAGLGKGDENGGGGDMEARFAQNDAEHEEIWDAIEQLAGAQQGGFGDSARPARDARRNRDGYQAKDEFPDKEDEDVNDELGPAPTKEGGNKGILPGFEMEAPPGTKAGDMRKARDSVLVADSFSETVAAAEIIVPGIKLPTFDRAAEPGRSIAAINALRMRALDLAYQQPETREIIERLTGGRYYGARRLTADALRMLFRAVADNKRQANQDNMRAGEALVYGEPVGNAIRSPAELQEMLDKHYSSQRHH